jgi:hypothetical protein
MSGAALAESVGVSLPSLRRFERRGLISLSSFLGLAMALGRLDDFGALLVPRETAATLEEFMKPTKKRQRGRNT